MEMLIVVTVIAILATLLMSGFQSVRETAYSVRCRSNLRQMAAASLTWSMDNTGFALPERAPDYTHFPVLLAGYLESKVGWAWTEKKIGGSIIQDCPGWRGRTGSVGGFGIDTWSLGYMINNRPGFPEAASYNRPQDPYYPFFDIKRFKLAGITRADSRLLFFDADDNQQSVEPIPSRLVLGNLSKQIGPRHRGGNSWAMWSGRVISRYSVEESVWRSTNQPEWQWGAWGDSDLWRTIYNPEQVTF